MRMRAQLSCYNFGDGICEFYWHLGVFHPITDITIIVVFCTTKCNFNGLLSLIEICNSFINCPSFNDIPQDK